MKIGIITDLHANLPALAAVLKALEKEKCQTIFHAGDAIAIGPYSAECIDLIQQTPNLKCVLGNHELYYVKGLPEPQPDWMSDGEVRHQQWTHAQLGDQRKSLVQQWPFILEEKIEGVHTVCVHYGLALSEDDFKGVVRQPTKADLDRIFADQQAEVLFSGHDHTPMDKASKARYINPGSLGCNREAVARYTIAEYDDSRVIIRNCKVKYDDQVLYEAFESRNVPDREFIYKVFFGGRFGA